MKKLITGVLERFIGSYRETAVQMSKGRFILFRVLLIPASVFVYALTFFVVLAVVLIVVLIVIPISVISKSKILNSSRSSGR